MMSGTNSTALQSLPSHLACSFCSCPIFSLFRSSLTFECFGLWSALGGSLRSGMDHVPGTGPHRVGMVTPSVESLHNPTQFGFDSTLDAVSRHCQKKLRCPIQSCLDAIKHCVHFRFGRFGDELLFGAQTCTVSTFWLKTKMDL